MNLLLIFVNRQTEIMKIICDAPGQTCNRLWSYIATISECIVKRKHMVILFYDYTISDFPNLRNCPFIHFPLYHPWWLNRGNNWNRFKSLTWKATHNKTWDYIFKHLGFIKGWHTRNQTKYIAEAKREIQKIFTPANYITDISDSFISDIKKTHDIIVGVHIRKGDYKDWNDGRFDFSLSDYRKYMEDFRGIFPNKKIAFFISSNISINTDFFSGLDSFIIDSESSPVLTDLYTLSKCDFIIGPPSTFSRWASFIGEKPLCFIYSKDQKINYSSFAIINDYFHFVNGDTIEDW